MVLICLKSPDFWTTNPQKADFLYVLEIFWSYPKFLITREFSGKVHFQKQGYFRVFYTSSNQNLSKYACLEHRYGAFSVFLSPKSEIGLLFEQFRTKTETICPKIRFSLFVGTKILFKCHNKQFKFADFSKCSIFCPFLA